MLLHTNVQLELQAIAEMLSTIDRQLNRGLRE